MIVSEYRTPWIAVGYKKYSFPFLRMEISRKKVECGFFENYKKGNFILSRRMQQNKGFYVKSQSC